MSHSVPLSDMAEINPPSPHLPAEEERVSFLPMAAVANDGGGFRPDARAYREVSKGYTPFASGDVLIAKITPCFENGKIAFIDRLPHRVGFGSTEFHVVRPHEGVDGRYLFHLLRSPRFRQDGEARMTGSAGQQRVPAQFLRDYELPSPALSEQKRIAAILDKADVIRAKRQEALAQMNVLLRSAFDHMVGFRAPGYDSWQLRSIESLAAGRPNALRTGPFGSDLRHSEFTDSGVVVLGIDNAVQNRFAWAERRFISPEKYRKLERYRVLPGDVIITIMGTTGHSAVVPDDIPLAISTKHLATITLDPDQADPHFISFAIHSDSRLRRQIEAANKGAIMDGLNLTIIRNLKLHLPPLPLQQRFGDLVRWHGTRVEQAQDAAQNGDALYASLAQRAFRGEL